MEPLTEADFKRYYEDAARYLLKPWRTRPSPESEPLIVGGDGAYFFDAAGREYLDFLSQLFNVNLGIGNRKVVEAVKRQVEEINYTKNTFLNKPKILLAKRLAEVTSDELSKTFFSNSGTEANEAAFKIARVYTGRFKVIGLWGSYHGSTFASMSAGGVASNRSPFEPLVPGFFHVPPPYCYRCAFGLEYPGCGLRCARFLEESIKFHGPETVAAFIADPVVVAAGVLVPPKEYWPTVREICDKYDVLLILDEVITGCGRTGRLFAHEHWGIVPDILTLAKGLSNACVPLGATVMNREISEFVTERKVFMHGFTYSGHALACAAGLAAIDAYIEGKVPENAAKVGEYLLDALRGIQDRHRSVGDVRGLGLIEGVEFVRDKETKEPLVAEDPEAPLEDRPLFALSDGCLKEGLLLMPSMSGSTLRMAPPLIITEDDVDKAMEILERQIEKVEKRFL
ncbi:MAG: aspartate aminotransferase family protein [Candidatus Bathyarchaeia archaeon]